MSDEQSVNEKIAALLHEQTYAERMEMATWFSGALSDLNAIVIVDDMASLFETWADSEMDESKAP